MFRFCSYEFFWNVRYVFSWEFNRNREKQVFPHVPGSFLLLALSWRLGGLKHFCKTQNTEFPGGCLCGSRWAVKLSSVCTNSTNLWPWCHVLMSHPVRSDGNPSGLLLLAASPPRIEGGGQSSSHNTTKSSGWRRSGLDNSALKTRSDGNQVLQQKTQTKYEK